VGRGGVVEERPPALVARGISKSFGGTRALADVGLTVHAGEVHGLLGENGSGKSTLIRILAGYHAPDSGGELEVAGRPVALPLRPGEPRRLGLSFVHQDLGLIPSLSVLENLRLCELAVGSGLRISWSSERRRAREAFARYGLELDPRLRVADLEPVERALLAIVRAAEEMRASGGLLVLDEPTAFLPRTETEQLLSLVRELAASGDSVLFVSHDLEEVESVTDRVTVLRDGRSVNTVSTREVATQDLVELIVGRRLGTRRPARREPLGEQATVSVAELSGESVRGVSFDFRQGEVLGLTGLAGSGFEEVLPLLCGARSASGGRLVLAGRSHDVTKLTPDSALRGGIALLPGDRHRDGGVGSLSVADNVTLPVVDRYAARGRLRRTRLLRDAGALLAKFDVRPRDPKLPYEALSGGNQQKALIAKWLSTTPRLLLLDEPTRGVDVGARLQIFALIREAAAAGASVLCASSDYEQLSEICDRVLVFSGGTVVSRLAGDDLAKERIAEACYRTRAAEPDGGGRP
jgi:ribose transport system ATP-binding protein